MTKIDISFMPVSEQVEMVKKYLQSREQHKVQGEVKLQQVMSHFKHQDLLDPKAKHAYFKKLYLAALDKIDKLEEIKIKKPVKDIKKRYTYPTGQDSRRGDAPAYRSRPYKDTRSYSSGYAEKPKKLEEFNSEKGSGYNPNGYGTKAPVKSNDSAKQAASGQDSKSKKEKQKDRKLNNESPPLYGDVKPYQKRPYRAHGAAGGARRPSTGIYRTDGDKTYGGVYRDENAPGYKKDRPKRSGSSDDRRGPRQRPGGSNDRNNNRGY